MEFQNAEGKPVRDRDPELGCRGRKREEKRTARVNEEERVEERGGDVVSNPRTQSFVSIYRLVHRRVGC